MSRTLRYTFFMMTLFVFFSISRAEENQKAQISSVSTTKSRASIEGAGGQDWELVLRIGKDTDAKPIEYSSTLVKQRPFTATVEYGKIVPLGNRQFGEGMVFKISHKNGGSTTNIGFDPNHPILSGTVHFRSGKDAQQGLLPIEQDGLRVIIADLVHDDGSMEPVTLFLRPR